MIIDFNRGICFSWNIITWTLFILNKIVNICIYLSLKSRVMLLFNLCITCAIRLNNTICGSSLPYYSFYLVLCLHVWLSPNSSRATNLNRQSLGSSTLFASTSAIERYRTREEIADIEVLNAILNQLWWALVQLEQK